MFLDPFVPFAADFRSVFERVDSRGFNDQDDFYHINEPPVAIATSTTTDETSALLLATDRHAASTTDRGGEMFLELGSSSSSIRLSLRYRQRFTGGHQLISELSRCGSPWPGGVISLELASHRPDRRL